MTRWRVDFRVKSDLVLAKDEAKVIFTAPDNTHEIFLFTKRRDGKHEADELFLSAHVILEDDNQEKASDKAEDYLRQFLEVLSITTSTFYRIEQRLLVADWSPGLDMRPFWYFATFPNPQVPKHALGQAHIDTVKKLLQNQIPRAVRLAMRWWKLGASARTTEEQFQYFWYALEILADHAKPSDKISSKCQVCKDDLFCRTCNNVPLHRPFPKQAIKILVHKHVRGKTDQFFDLIDRARNMLLHGLDPDQIEGELKIKWNELSDALGQVTRKALLRAVVDLRTEEMTQPDRLELFETNTFAHYDMATMVGGAMGSAYADPNNPQIEEFQPTFTLSMNAREEPGRPQQKTAGAPEKPPSS